jgi:DNA topoisomerase-2
MWSGSKNTQTIESYVLRDDPDAVDGVGSGKIFVLEELKYPPALLKIIDETIVNAIDHHTHYPDKVKEIKISLDENGVISVYNDGPGIPVEKTANINGVEMYTPQLIASEFLAGDNLDDDGDNIKGGTNGIGLKLVSAFSEWMKLETVDSDNHIKYSQSFLDGLTKIEDPILETVTKKTKSYTNITFKPNYEEFKLDITKFHNTLHEILQTRSWQAAAYTSAKVYYNDELIPLESFGEFCQMFSENEIYETSMADSDSNYSWDICLTVSDGKEQHMSVVNGVYMPKGGTHIKHIQNHLIENLKEKVEKEIKKTGVKFNRNYITNNVFIFMKGSIPSPEFLSQTKEAISDPIEKFKNYQIDDKEWKKIWEILSPAIISAFLKKSMGDIKTRANRGKVVVPKYKEAKYCRDAKKCKKCGLVITEGDSATGTVNTGLLNTKLLSKTSPNFNYDWFGVFGIKGVPINALKESAIEAEIGKRKKRGKGKSEDDTEHTLKSAKSTKKKTTAKKSKDDLDLPPKRVPNQKLQKNERIDSLKKVLGLDFNKTYGFDEVGEKEWGTLRYGYILGLMDQDLDGFNIFGLVSTFIMTYWPSLVKRDFIRRINTPVLRFYPKNKKKDTVKEFYSERDAKSWFEEVGEEYVKSKYNKPKYYKGLAAHDQGKKEVTQMFKHIDEKICIYTLDEQALKNMHIYYGTDTKPRKIALSTPVTREPIDGLEIPISQQFEIDTKLYQRDNIIRKLLNSIDGFVSSRRKVFYVARKNGHKEIKVAGLASDAVKYANYHHGEVSLEQTIVRMAQGFPGARNLPLLLPCGNFGSRAKGYKDSGASRYIHTMINYRLADKLFRKEDDFILEYEVDDGERYEPKYYVPIIPYVLCENNELPATGWAISIHARDVYAVIRNTRNMIEGKITKCKKLPIWNKDFKGEIRTYKNREYYVGRYEYNSDDNTVHITELTPGIYSDAYCFGADAGKVKKEKKEKSTENKKKKKENRGISIKKLVEDVEDNTSTEEGVDITIILKPGAFDIIAGEDSKYGNETFDAFEEYFELKEPIYNRINLVNEKGEVVEYKTYENVFNDWFVFRKKLYEVRVEREKILVDLEIQMLKNMQRFSENHDAYGITNKTQEDEAVNLLKREKYKIFNHTILDNPRFTELKELVKLITLESEGANYDYILKMSYRDLTENAYSKRQKKINELEERLAYLSDDAGLFIGAKIWLKELEELEKAIRDGIASNWFYGDNDYKFDDE